MSLTYTHQLLFIFPYCRFFSQSLLSVGQLFRSRGNFAYEIFGHTLMKADYTMRSIFKTSINNFSITHCNPLQGKYRFFTGISLCTNSHLHALAVYRVWRVKFHWNTGKYIHFVQELAFYIYIHVYVFITGISLLLEKQQHGILQKQGKPCK